MHPTIIKRQFSLPGRVQGRFGRVQGRYASENGVTTGEVSGRRSRDRRREVVLDGLRLGNGGASPFKKKNDLEKQGPLVEGYWQGTR